MSRARRRLTALGLGLLLLFGLIAGLNAYARSEGFGSLVFDNISPPPELGYRWLPDQHLLNPVGDQIDINDYGMRDPRQVAIPKPAGTFRVLCLGDSFTYGLGIPWEQTAAQVLERALRERATGRPGPAPEVWNAGVNGYNSCQERLWLETYGWALAPDVVTVGFVMNDAIPPAPNSLSREFPGRAWMLRYPLYHWLRSNVVHKWRLMGDDADAQKLQELINRQRGLIETSPSASPEVREFWNQATDCLAEAARACKQRGVPMVLIVYPSLPQMLRRAKDPDSRPEPQQLLGEVAAREGMILVDLLDAYAAAGAPALLEMDKSHPSALGNEITARELQAALEAAGALPPTRGAPSPR